MQERIKTSIYWLICAVVAIIAPYKYSVYIHGFTKNNAHNLPIFMMWLIGVVALTISIAAVCFVAFGFYKWMHWLLNGEEKHTGGSDSTY